MTISVLRAGALTTVQDLGRARHQHDGVPESGAMDGHALRLANLLVGNPDHAAGLEATLTGPALRFDVACTIALGGADFGARLDGAPLAPWFAVPVSPGATLELGAAPSLCRAYLAVSGGIAVPPVLDSRSTYLLAELGGLEGRTLRTGDVLPVGRSERPLVRRALSPALRPRYEGVARLLAGPATTLLDEASRAALFASERRVSARSDRMGYRLEGPALSLRERVEPLSAAVPTGTVQLPPGGSPIVLMADHQTTGGYPVIGYVAAVDLGNVAQLRPGDALRFAPISLEEAQRLYLERERAVDALRRALALAS